MDHVTHRIPVSFSDETFADLEEIARLEESSIASVVRDCVRATLPQFLGVTRFIHDPRNSSADVQQFGDEMERVIGLMAGAGGGAARAAAGPPPRDSGPAEPPSSNRGVK